MCQEGFFEGYVYNMLPQSREGDSDFMVFTEVSDLLSRSGILGKYHIVSSTMVVPYRSSTSHKKFYLQT